MGQKYINYGMVLQYLFVSDCIAVILSNHLNEERLEFLKYDMQAMVNIKSWTKGSNSCKFSAVNEFLLREEVCATMNNVTDWRWRESSRPTLSA